MPDTRNSGHSQSHYNAIPRSKPILTSALSTTSTASPPSSPSSPVSLSTTQPAQSLPQPPNTLTTPLPIPATVNNTLQPQAAFHHPAPHKMISKIKPEELQESVKTMIAGQSSIDGLARQYKINPPPVGRPVRIYADGKFVL